MRSGLLARPRASIPPILPNTPTKSSLSDITSLRREAESLARERGERPISTHMLIVLATREGLPAQLLAERRMNQEALIKSLRIATDDDHHPIERVLSKARDFAQRTSHENDSTREATPLHVLLAICSDRTTAAYKALVLLGIDLARLRAVLTQHLTGSVEPRRPIAERASNPSKLHQPLEKQSHSSLLQPSKTRILPKLPAKLLRPLPTKSLPAIAPSNKSTSNLKTSSEPNVPVVVLPSVENTPIIEAPLPSDLPLIKTRKLPKNQRHSTVLPKASATPFDLDPKLAPTLCTIGINLTAAAMRNELDPVIGRDTEIEKALDVLAKRNANNPCLIGVAGVGKTAVVHGIARRLCENFNKSGVHNPILVEVPIGELLAGTNVRGALAERLSLIRKEVRASSSRILIFFDSIHALLSGDTGDEAANELKAAFARGELPCIGATTPSEYRKLIECDPALSRQFSSVEVAELDAIAARPILDAACQTLEQHHHVTYDLDAREASISWTVRYLPMRALPDKAIAALDLAGARTKRTHRTQVTREIVAQAVSEMADVPIARLLESDAERFLNLEKKLAERVVGHSEILTRIAAALRRGAAGLRGARPLFSALFLGPTGVGKTETAKAIADVLFDHAQAFTRIDLSEYSEPHSVARLIGAPPGYIGHEEGGQLTEAIRRKPYQVILLDEMEKAHRDVLETLLQFLDEGRLTDGRGRTIDCTNTVIVLTSNLGASAVDSLHSRRVGFGRIESPLSVQQELEPAMIAAARAALPPELYNRFDEVFVFAPLARADVFAIAEATLKKLGDELKSKRELALQVDREAIDWLLDHGGFDPTLGARPIRRLIHKHIEAPMAELLLRGQTKPGDTLWVTVDHQTIVIELL